MKFDWKHLAIAVLGSLVALITYIYTTDKSAQAKVNEKTIQNSEDIASVLKVLGLVNFIQMSTDIQETKATVQELKGSVSRLENRLK